MKRMIRCSLCNRFAKRAEVFGTWSPQGVPQVMHRAGFGCRGENFHRVGRCVGCNHFASVKELFVAVGKGQMHRAGTGCRKPVVAKFVTPTEPKTKTPVQADCRLREQIAATVPARDWLGNPIPGYQLTVAFVKAGVVSL